MRYPLLISSLCLAAIVGCQTTDRSGQPPLEPSTDQQPASETASKQTAAGALPAAAAPADPAYAELGNHKAQAYSLALSPSAGAPLSYSNHTADMPSPVAAAMQALAECEQARASRATPTSACEILRRNDTLIHSTAELTQDLPAQRPAFIWRIEQAHSDGGETVLHLAGSVHVLKPTLQAPPSYFAAFDKASTLVLEVDQGSATPEQTGELIARYGAMPAGTNRADLFSPAEIARIDSYVSGLGIPVAMIANMKPAMLLLQASVLEYMAMGYLPQHGVDSVFEAQKGNRTLVALETIEEQLAAATALPLPLQAELLLETLSEADNASLEISKLVHAWLAGDPRALNEAFNNNTESAAAQAWLDDLLAKRNVTMAEGLAQMLNNPERSQSIFALVGAAHLVGEGSVIELLEAKGFRAQRLQHRTLQPVR